jgi:hypothetical protein
MEKVISKLKQALWAVEDAYRVIESLSCSYHPNATRLPEILFKLDDVIRLLDDALIIVELEYFKQPLSVQERFARGVEKALEG